MLAYIYVEGLYDQIFLENLNKRIFTEKFNPIYIPYSGETIDSINNWLKSSYSLKELRNADIIYLRDSDFNNREITIDQLKLHILEEHNVEMEDIVVVIIEIESWYYAGLQVDDCRNLEVPIFANNQKVNKEMLEEAAINKGYTLKELLLEMIEYFDIEEAQNNNSSFEFFMNVLNHKFEDYLTIN